MNYDETKHKRDSDGKFTYKNGESSSDSVKAQIAWARKNGQQLPHNNDCSLNDIALQKMYDERKDSDKPNKDIQDLPMSRVNDESQDDDNNPSFGSQEELDNFLGEEFKGYKGQAAIDKLLKEQRGHVKAAFHRDDIGDIDLIWGNEKAGLLHAITQRKEEKNGDAHAKDMIDNLANAVSDGVYNGKNKYGNFEIVYNKNGALYYAVIAPEYHENKLVFLVTSFRRGKIKK